MYEKRGSGGKCLSCKIQTTTFERSGAPKFSFTFDGGRLTWAINSIGYGQGEKSSSKNVQKLFANISVRGCHCITAPKTRQLGCNVHGDIKREKKLQSVQNCRWALVIVIHACWRCICIYCHGACSPLCSFFFNFRLWACTNPHSHSILSNKKRK